LERQSSSATGGQSDEGFFFRRISTVKPHQIACVEIGEIAKPPWDFSSSWPAPRSALDSTAKNISLGYEKKA